MTPAHGVQERVKVHVLVTSYESVLLELGELKRLEWEVLIVDEGHRLKNRESRLFQVGGRCVWLSELQLPWYIKHALLCKCNINSGTAEQLPVERGYLYQ